MEDWRLKFKSGNNVEVRDAQLTRKEYLVIEAEISELKDELRQIKSEWKIVWLTTNEQAAHIERLREFINEAMLESLHPFVASILLTALEEKPAQSLVVIKAAAIEEMVKNLHVIPRHKDAMLFTSSIIEYIAQLRHNTKG